MCYGSGSGKGFRSGADINCNKKVKKSKIGGQVLGISYFLTKDKILCNFVVFGNCLDPEPEPEP